MVKKRRIELLRSQNPERDRRENRDFLADPEDLLGQGHLSKPSMIQGKFVNPNGTAKGHGIMMNNWTLAKLIRDI